MTDRRPPGGDAPVHRGARYYRVGRRRGWVKPTAFWSVWLIVALVASAAYGAWAFVDETVSSVTSTNSVRVKKFKQVAAAPVLPGQPITVLLLGSDSRDTRPGADPGRSDSMIMVRIDNQRNFISMLSFPRDSYVEIPGYGQNKLNAAYSYGEQQSSGGGPALVAKTLTQLTGQKINYYANIDFKGFVNVVDNLGGVYLDIDRRYYHKNTPGTEQWKEIDIQPGYQKLKGSDALDFVRFRHLDSDFARIVRQQMFLSEIKRQIKGDLGNILEAPRTLRMLLNNAETTMDGDRLLDVLRFAVELPDSRVYRRTVEGSLDMTADGQSIVVLNSQEVAAGVQDWLNPPFTATAPAKKVDPASVSVQVMNGSGRGLVATTMAGLLAREGYRTTSAGNVPSGKSYSANTVLFDATNPKSQSAATALTQAIGPATAMTAVGPSALGGGDVAVVVGTDFDGALHPPPPAPKVVEKADVVSTTSLVTTFRDAARTSGMPLAVPTRVAAQSRVVDVRTYRIGDKDKGPWAVKVVFELPGVEGYPRFWGIMATEMKNPPILTGGLGPLKKADGLAPIRTYYNGKLLVRDAFQYRGVNYWISNTIDNRAPLNSLTIHSIARSFRPVRSAKLPKGTVDTAISIQQDSTTP